MLIILGCPLMACLVFCSGTSTERMAVFLIAGGRNDPPSVLSVGISRCGSSESLKISLLHSKAIDDLVILSQR